MIPEINMILGIVIVVLSFYVIRRIVARRRPRKHRHHRHTWVVRRTISIWQLNWPYEHGYGTYCPGCKTVWDTGLTREEAERRRDALNAQARLAPDWPPT